MKYSPLIFACALSVSIAALAQDAPMPSLHEGDKWIFNVKIDQSPGGSSSRKWESSVVRASSSSLVIARKPTDSNLPPQEAMMASDWSSSASVNGKMTTTVKNFDFPLKQGKKWDISYITEKPNDKIKLVKRTFSYKVLGWEEIKVAAGTFKALKIEAEGDWHHEFLPTNALAASRVEAGSSGNSVIMQTRSATTPEAAAGKYYKAIWYVPEVKREVKLIEETFNSAGGVSNRTTLELESYQVQP